MTTRPTMRGSAHEGCQQTCGLGVRVVLGESWSCAAQRSEAESRVAAVKPMNLLGSLSAGAFSSLHP